MRLTAQPQPTPKSALKSCLQHSFIQQRDLFTILGRPDRATHQSGRPDLYNAATPLTPHSPKLALSPHGQSTLNPVVRYGQTVTCVIKTNSLSRLQECFSTAGWPYAERGTHKPKAALKAIPFPAECTSQPINRSDHREDGPCFHAAMRYQASRIVPAQRGLPSAGISEPAPIPNSHAAAAFTADTGALAPPRRGRGRRGRT